MVLKQTLILINLGILILSLIGVSFLVYKIKFKDNNYRLLFILYTFCWIGPMILREYTSQMHSHMDFGEVTKDNLLPYVLVVYGLVGLLWRPLTDVFAFKLNSRKKVIYVSLLFQFVCYIPMLVYPCLATNIIQSIGCGIGASCLGLFNLMFNEQHAKQKIFLTATLLSLPPLLAEFISSVLQSLVTSFLPKNATNNDYLDIVKWMWFIALLFLIFAAVIGFFVKENTALLYKDNQYKEPVSTTSSWFIVILICLATMMTSFTKFTTSGPASITQLDYIATYHMGRDSIKGYDGYLSTIFTIGQIAGNLIIGLILSKKFNEWTLFTGGIGCWIIFMILTTTIGVQNPYVFLAVNVLNGFAFGITYNIIVRKMIKKFFLKSNVITPMSVYNTSLSIGIVASTWFNPWMKKTVFGALTNYFKKYDEAIKNNNIIPKISLNDWNNFVHINNIVNVVVIATIVVMWIAFSGAFFIEKKYPPKLIKLKHQYQSSSDMDD